MSAAIVAFMLLESESNGKVKRKVLRDRSNVLDNPELAFVDQYRLSKDAFIMVLESIKDNLHKFSIPPVLQLAATLRFLAEGSYQRSVGNDLSISLARPTVSLVLTHVLKVLERILCREWIKLNMDANAKQISRDHFYRKHKIPGITGCIDGTHLQIIKPHDDEHLYYNRKGYFSMNAMIICDNDMMIRAVDARYPGSNHDSFIWNISSARQYFLRQYEAGDRSCRLLGDSGYGIEPFLLTPYRSPQYNSPQHKFNMAHSSARNIVERTIGVLKGRFRCLIRQLHYHPEKVARMMNVCCSLHNICRTFNVRWDETNNFLQSNDVLEENNLPASNSTLQSEGNRLRDEIMNTL